MTMTKKRPIAKLIALALAVIFMFSMPMTVMAAESKAQARPCEIVLEDHGTMWINEGKSFILPAVVNGEIADAWLVREYDATAGKYVDSTYAPGDLYFVKGAAKISATSTTPMNQVPLPVLMMDLIYQIAFALSSAIAQNSSD